MGFTGLIGWPGSFSLGVWWAGPASLALAALVGTGVIDLAPAHQPGKRAQPLVYQLPEQHRQLSSRALLSLGWLYRLLWWIYRRLAQAIQVLTDILEGDGGVLWAMVLLALIISLLQSRLAR